MGLPVVGSPASLDRGPNPFCSRSRTGSRYRATLLLPHANPDRPYADGRLRIGIAATRDHPDAIAAGYLWRGPVWEYIRLYMQEGAAALPPNSSRGPYRLSRVGEAVRYFNPLKALKVSHPARPRLPFPSSYSSRCRSAPLLMLGDVFTWDWSAFCPAADGRRNSSTLAMAYGTGGRIESIPVVLRRQQRSW